MKLTRSFRTRLFVGFLLASLLPLLLCSAMLLQIFRLQMEAQADSESDVQLIHVTTALDGLYDGFRQTSLALKASPYVAPALAQGQTDSSMVYSELYSATEGSRSSAQFDLYDKDGLWLYSTQGQPFRAELEALLMEKKKAHKEGKAHKTEKTQREEVGTSPSSLPEYRSDSKKGRT